MIFDRKIVPISTAWCDALVLSTAPIPMCGTAIVNGGESAAAMTMSIKSYRLSY